MRIAIDSLEWFERERRQSDLTQRTAENRREGLDRIDRVYNMFRLKVLSACSASLREIVFFVFSPGFRPPSLTAF